MKVKNIDTHWDGTEEVYILNVTDLDEAIEFVRMQTYELTRCRTSPAPARARLEDMDGQVLAIMDFSGQPAWSFE